MFAYVRPDAVNDWPVRNAWLCSLWQWDWTAALCGARFECSFFRHFERACGGKFSL